MLEKKIKDFHWTVKIIICMIILFVISRLWIESHYISYNDPTGDWKVVYYQPSRNPDHTWDGYLYYYGKNVPEQIRILDGEDTEQYEIVSESFKHIDPTTNDNAYRIFLDCIAFTPLPKARYSFMCLAPERPEKIMLNIQWDGGSTTIDTSASE